VKASLELWRWGGEIASPVLAKRRELGERRTILVVLRTELGATGLGEAAPLPGYSPDTIDNAWAALEEVSVGPLVEAARAGGLESLGHALDEARLVHSARFAVETAVLDAIARESSQVSMVSHITSVAKPYAMNGAAISSVLQDHTVSRSGLAGVAGDADVRVSALSLRARGIGTIKLKASGAEPALEAAWLRALGHELGAVLRLDLNGALAVEQAPAALEAYASAGVELVEEPCAGAALLELGPCAVRWFADEALVDAALAARLIAHPGCAGLVLKPTVLGGFGACLELARRAIDAGKRVIVTHCFEGPVCLAAVAELALAVAAMERAAGSEPLAMGVDQHAGLGAFPALVLPQLPERSEDGALAILDPPRVGLGLDAGAIRARLGS
jgi:L-alanine-DL-glutamate epimerase-like enolase superfamily enzyme